MPTANESLSRAPKVCDFGRCHTELIFKNDVTITVSNQMRDCPLSVDMSVLK